MSEELKVVGRDMKHAWFDQMSWPIPNHHVGWQVRYMPTPPTTSMMHAASELDAYARLIALPQKKRNHIIKQIRLAMGMSEFKDEIDMETRS